MATYYSHGKLLLTGEYLVLDGAKALALPTKFGQRLTVTKTKSSNIHWKSYDENNALWFEGFFLIENGIVKPTEYLDTKTSERLVEILNVLFKLQPSCFNEGLYIETHLEFNRHWGLGSSSTLIASLAAWTGVDPYVLLKETFGGSGYDIACANAIGPILYQLQKNSAPKVETVAFNPPFKEHLYFVYLNKKQNSRKGISQYRKNQSVSDTQIESINTITSAMVSCETLVEFESLLSEHEALISAIIGLEPIQNSFPDFEGCLKSLGAWGGDFILACSKVDPTSYFQSRGFTTIIPYQTMVL